MWPVPLIILVMAVQTPQTNPLAQEAPHEDPSATAEQAPDRQPARMGRHHSFETSISHEAFGRSVPAARFVSVSTTIRVTDTLRLAASGQQQQKFGRVETRAGAGVEWWPREALDVAVDALGGPGNEQLPALDAGARVSYSRGRLELTGRIRHLRFQFPETNEWVLSPGLTVWLNDRFAISGRAAEIVSRHQGVNDTIRDWSVALNSHVRLLAGVWLDGGYAHGLDGFDDPSPDRAARYSAHSVRVGTTLDMPWRTSLRLGGDEQWRTTGLQVRQLSISLARRF